MEGRMIRGVESAFSCNPFSDFSTIWFRVWRNDILLYLRSFFLLLLVI